MAINRCDGLTLTQRETVERGRFWFRVGLALIAVIAAGTYGTIWLIGSLMHA